MTNFEWIPVQERLPNDSDSVLITFTMDNSYGKGTDIEYVVCEGHYDSDGGYLQLNDDLPGGFNTYNDWNEGQPIEILAWMPMPEPYKKDDLYLNALDAMKKFAP